MNPHQRVIEASRRIREPLYLVTGLYVVIGFCVGFYGAVTGDRLAAFLGFFFVSGALASALVFHGMSRLALRIAAINEHLEHLRAAVDRLEHLSLTQSLPTAELSSDVIHLGDQATGDPTPLTGASLEEDRFPRLVRVETTLAAVPLESTNTLDDDLPDGWHEAYNEGDVRECRRMVEEAAGGNPATLEKLRRQFEELARVTEQQLREAFTERVRERDFAGAMAVGERILDAFMDEPIAAEFERIRPLLMSRVQQTS